jgi:hypothetical protein
MSEYKKIDLFGKKQSRGTFDDFFNPEKYKTIQEAYDANDYVECDHVKDEKDIIYIQAFNWKNPHEKKYHRLEIQKCIFGIDMLDDQMACDMAASLL